MQSKNNTSGYSFIFSFPYMIIIDTEAPPTVEELEFRGLSLRIYPPFRSAPANFVPAPEISKKDIPFLPDTSNLTNLSGLISNTAVIPLLVKTDDGQQELIVLNTPDWQPFRPRFFPMDSLRVDVWGFDFNAYDDYTAQQHTDRAEEVANTLTLELMRLLRWKSKQWWMNRTGGPTHGLLRTKFMISQNGAIESPFLPTAVAELPRGDEIPIDQQLWTASISDFKQSIEVPIYHELLLDARFYVPTDVRLAILNAAVACEGTKNLVVERLWRSQHVGDTYTLGDGVENKYIMDQLDTDFQKLAGHSYKSEHPQEFSLIGQLWTARNLAAHGTKLKYHHSKKTIEVDTDLARQFTVAAEHLVNWLEDLT